jgi:hypothetical protein
MAFDRPNSGSTDEEISSIDSIERFRRSTCVDQTFLNTTDASANERIGVQGKADAAARTGRPGRNDNAAMRVDTSIPFGLPA